MTKYVDVDPLLNKLPEDLPYKGAVRRVLIMAPAADVVDAAKYEELFQAAVKMHEWIFLHTGNELEVYDECGLSDEMNALLGYAGRIEVIELPKEDDNGQ